MYNVVVFKKDGTVREFYSKGHFKNNGGMVSWDVENGGVVAIPMADISQIKETKVKEQK